MNIEDFKGVNRALKRKVKKARKDDVSSMTESTDFMEYLSKAFDELLFKHTHIELPHWVEAERSET